MMNPDHTIASSLMGRTWLLACIDHVLSGDLLLYHSEPAGIKGVPELHALAIQLFAIIRKTWTYISINKGNLSQITYQAE